MQIISSCTKIVSAPSICSSHSLLLFTEFDSFVHFSCLMALTTPYLSLYWLPSLLFQTSTNFCPNHICPERSLSFSLWSAWCSPQAVRATLSLPRLVSLLFLSSSVHGAQPDRNQADKWEHTVHTNTYKPLNRAQHVGIHQGCDFTGVNYWVDYFKL